MKIKKVNIHSIKMEDRLRQDLGDIESLVRDIRLHGLIQPITVTSDLSLVAGGRRLSAFLMMNSPDHQEIPCIVIPNSSKVNRTLIEIVENSCRKDFTWPERCRAEKKVYDLKKEENPKWTHEDQAILLGISHGSVGRRLALAEALGLFHNLEKIVTEDGAWKKLQDLQAEAVRLTLAKKVKDALVGNETNTPLGYTITEKAAAWLKVADASYIIGDALEGLRKYKAGSFGFAEIDPPFGIDLDKYRKDDRADIIGMTEEYTEVSKIDYPKFIGTLIPLVFRVLREDSFAIVWHADEWMELIKECAIKAGFTLGVVRGYWVKEGAGECRSPEQNLSNVVESFLILRKGKAKLNKSRSNVFNYKMVAHSEKIHITEKPIELIKDIIQTFVTPGSSIVCPFLGSGVTIRASLQLSYLCRGWDLAKTHKDRFLANVIQDFERGELK